MMGSPSFAGLVELLLAAALGLTPAAQTPESTQSIPPPVKELQAAFPPTLPADIERASTSLVHNEMYAARAVYTQNADSLALALASLPEQIDLSEQKSVWLDKKREAGTVEMYRGRPAVVLAEDDDPRVVVPLSDGLLLAAVGLHSPTSIFRTLDGLDLDELVAIHSGTTGTPTSEAFAAFLPNVLPGNVRRSNVQSGQRNGAPGARSTYSGSEGMLHLTISHDPEGPSSILSQFAVAEEESVAFTETVRGHPTYESDGSGDEQLVLVRVGQHIFVSAFTRDDLSRERLYEALRAIEWKQLESRLDPPGRAQ